MNIYFEPTQTPQDLSNSLATLLAVLLALKDAGIEHIYLGGDTNVDMLLTNQNADKARKQEI